VQWLNQTWALDFINKTLYDGQRVRLLTKIDEGNREGSKIAMGLSLPGSLEDRDGTLTPEPAGESCPR